MQSTAELARLYKLALQEPTFDLTGLFQLQARLLACVDVEGLARTLAEGLRMSLAIRRGAVYVRTDTASYRCTNAFDTTHGGGSEIKPNRMPVLEPSHEIVAELSEKTPERLVLHSRSGTFDSFVRAAFPHAESGKGITCYPMHASSRLEGILVVDLLGSGDSVEATGAKLLLLARQAGAVLDKVRQLEDSQTELTRVRALLDEERRKRTEHGLGSLIGGTPRMLRIFDSIRTVAPLDVPVLIVGETGTGKELVARALHDGSARNNKPFVSVNCAAVPSQLVESELFGHEKGAFTGAQSRRSGKVEAARGGTLFLDEISEMPENLQAKLLRFLQEHTFERIGGNEVLNADVRILAATNRRIDDAVNTNRLRRDLVYRLNTIVIELPPLRERLDDIPQLVNLFIRAANERYDRSVKRLDAETLTQFLRYRWPGNVRELQNTVDRAVIFSEGDILTAEAIPLSSEGPEDTQEDNRILTRVVPQTDRSLTEVKKEFVARFEEAYMRELLKMCRGNLSEAARMARIDKKNFFEKMRRYGIDREQYTA